ncbi:oligosaccharide flippase family protein [Microbacterium sp. X-17]|uniref:oligosaccharide flippase family protein n=1 Tax=Microbacterium sp. X-17 TaxID=3144404 RepID=UPI0031F50477
MTRLFTPFTAGLIGWSVLRMPGSRLACGAEGGEAFAMTDDERTDEPRTPRRGLRGHVKAHAAPLTGVAIASLLGAAASFVFQILSARYLAPVDFGLLAAFLVIVNVAAIGSAALQNTVVVHTASSDPNAASDTRRGRRWPVDAVTIGLSGALVVCVLSPWLAQALDTGAWVLIVAAATVPFSFVFADAVGLLQGSGRVGAAIWWSTGTQVARVAAVLAVIAVGAGLGGVIGSVLATLILAAAGATWTARRIRRPSSGVFTVTGLVIITLTVAFTWLTGADVFFLRAAGPAELTGAYASVVVLVKGAFLLPSTLSLYLLPRFVRNRDNPKLLRLGVAVTLGASLATSVLMILVFAVAGQWLVPLLFGSAYTDAISLLIPISVAYMPWMAAQGMLIKMTSSASPAGAIFTVAVVIVQGAFFALVAPNVEAMLIGLFVLGVLLLSAFLVLDAMRTRRTVSRR